MGNFLVLHMMLEVEVIHQELQGLQVDLKFLV
jgi:hypothetical protein